MNKPHLPCKFYAAFPSIILIILIAFKKDWGNELEKYFTDHPEDKDAIDSIMRNRHLIAHGKSTSVSVARVQDFLNRSLKVISFLEHQIYGT